MKLNIFGKIYRVLKSHDKTSPNDAEILFDDGIISINKDLVGDVYMQKIVHEICHVVIDRVSINQGEMSHDIEEIICDTFSKAMTENFIIVPKDDHGRDPNEIA